MQGDARGEEESKRYILHEQQRIEISRHGDRLRVMITSDLKCSQ